MCTGLDLQNKGWMGHCTHVMEAGLAIQHWSGKLEGCALHSQHCFDHIITRGI